MNPWLPVAERIPNSHTAGLPMSGGGHYATHHITVTPKGSYSGAKAALIREGFEPTLTVDPVLGKIGQFIPGNRGAYAMEHTTAETNTLGAVHVQIEWVWPDMSQDITKAPHFDWCWEHVVAFLREWGVPDEWPFGFHSSSRSVTTWKKPGHNGHKNAPGNSHSDNLPAQYQPAWPGKPSRKKLRARARSAAFRARHPHQTSRFKKVSTHHAQRST